MTDVIRRAEPVMGTVVSFFVQPGDADRATVFLALAEARAALHRTDAVFSTWKPDSPMSRLRRSEIDLDASPAEVQEVLERCREARERSGGWFDPWAMPGGVDPTGLVKGWAAGRALRMLVEAGVGGAMVSAGGDLAVFGQPEPGQCWRIGIQNPFDRDSVAAVAEPAAAIATSGSYERGLHVIDPHTGAPASAVASASVAGPDLAMADALATGLAAGGLAALAHVEAYDGYEALLIGHDGTFHRTSGFPLVPVGGPLRPDNPAAEV